MNNFFGLLGDLSELAFEIGRVAAGRTARAAWIVMRRISIAFRVAVLWPFILLLVAIPNYQFAQYAVPILTIFALVFFLLVMTAPGPLAILIVQAALPTSTPHIGRFVSEVRRLTNILRFIIGVELLISIGFTCIPVAKNHQLALLLVLVMAAIACFVGISKKVVEGLTAGALVIILILFCEGIGDSSKVFAQGLPWFHHSDEHSNSIPKPSPGKIATQPSVAATTQATNNDPEIEQPLAPARPTAVQTPPEAPSPAPSEENHRVPYTRTVEAQEFMPISGNEGLLLVRMTGCRYIFAGEIGCEGYVQSKEGFAGKLLYLNDGSGVDNRGNSFNVWLSGGSIKFKGPNYPAHLSVGMKSVWAIHFHAPSGVTEIGFNLQVTSDDDGHWHEYQFVNIPVSTN